MRLAPLPADPLAPLSKREREVFVRAVRGSTQQEIAEELGLGKPTVNTHITRAREKLGLSGLVEMVRFAMLHGVIE